MTLCPNQNNVQNSSVRPFLGVPFAGPPPCVRFPFLGTRSPANLAVAAALAMLVRAASCLFSPRKWEVWQDVTRWYPKWVPSLCVRDIPELLAEIRRDGNGSDLDKAIGDLTLIAFYYLLWIREYTIKGKRNETKQTVQFKYEDVTFFKKNTSGQLRCLSRQAPAHLIATADGATMKLDNQKNGWKGVCVYQETNGEDYLCPVRALGRCFLHIRKHGGSAKTFLSSYWTAGKRADVTAKNISRALKLVATELQCNHWAVGGKKVLSAWSWSSFLMLRSVLVRCGFIASIDEVAKCKNYVDHEAVRIYQSCYQDTKYSSFTIKDYEGHDNLNGLTGVISSYDCVRHQYNIIIKGNQDQISTRGLRISLRNFITWYFMYIYTNFVDYFFFFRLDYPKK